MLLSSDILLQFSNALKFTRPGIEPDINIYAENRPEAVWLWIEDRGIGVDLKDLAAIFMIFRRAEGSGIYPGVFADAIAERGRQDRGKFESWVPRCRQADHSFPFPYPRATGLPGILALPEPRYRGLVLHHQGTHTRDVRVPAFDTLVLIQD